MKVLQATCIVGAITFTGMIYLVGGNTPGATVPEAAVSAKTPDAPALSAAAPDATAEPGSALGSVTTTVSSSPLMVPAEIGDGPIETKPVDSKPADSGHLAAAQPAPTARDGSGDASNPAPVTQDFRYLVYYVWSELPPAEKPAAIVLRSLKDAPVGTPVDEIKRASDAFGLAGSSPVSTPSNAPGRISACSN